MIKENKLDDSSTCTDVHSSLPRIHLVLPRPTSLQVLPKIEQQGAVIQPANNFLML